MIYFGQYILLRMTVPNMNKRIAELVFKYLQDRLSITEREELNSWIQESPENQATFDLVTNRQDLGRKYEAYTSVNSKDIWDRIERHVNATDSGNSEALVKRRTVLMIAASVFFLIGVLIYVLWFNEIRIPETGKMAKSSIHDVPPGSNKAVLTLSDGTTIILDSGNNRVLAQQGLTTINKKDGEVVYRSENQGGAGVVNEASLINMVSTPKSGQFKVHLPDGSMVWLNALSSIRFPVAFSDVERRVEVSGEVYFEVRKDTRRSFRVIILPVEGRPQCEITVLGTHFNVNAYPEETELKASLLEGKIAFSRDPGSLSKPQVVLPGQQAIVQLFSPVVQVRNDLTTYSAADWTRGTFHFDHSRIESVMNQLARWYDIELVYDHAVTGEQFSGDIPRDVSLANVLYSLKFASANTFIIEGKRLYIIGK